MGKNCSRIISIVLIFNLILVTSGCSLFAPRTQLLTVTISEDDAKIYINGNLEGQGIVQTVVPRNRDVGILVKKEGYETMSKTIGTTISGIGTIDMIFGWLIIPLFGLLGPGFHKLETDNLTLLMHEEKD